MNQLIPIREGTVHPDKAIHCNIQELIDGKMRFYVLRETEEHFDLSVVLVHGAEYKARIMKASCPGHITNQFIREPVPEELVHPEFKHWKIDPDPFNVHVQECQAQWHESMKRYLEDS